MNKICFNDNWICYETKDNTKSYNINLPHDAMLYDDKADDSITGVNLGWYVPKDYTYEKEFDADLSWKNQVNILYFEGVYHKATVLLNGEKLAYHDYGYTGFYVDISNALKYGDKNVLKVEVINTDQPNSRWYSGTGIYRPVWLYQMPEKHIMIDGIKVTTLSVAPVKIQVTVKTNAPGKVAAEINELNVTSIEDSNGSVSIILEPENAMLWSTDNPKLYDLKVTYGEDVRYEKIGIRTISYDAKTGFTINGKREILRGACIHHDNGLLGAAAYDFAEYRKIKLMQDNGYNAIRSAHNPCSEAMLRACDELGMLVMDEYVDAWYIHKTKNDYATNVEKNYKVDLKAIVDKDYNHPSVIMYSTGNEVAETAQPRGIKLCRDMTNYLHELDATRPVSCGVNIFFNFLSSMGFGVYSDKKAELEAKNVKKKKAVGSEFFNNMAGILGADFMKFGATLYPCDLKTKDAFAGMDFAGYNYGINRYKHDLKKYPNRLILGSETFCSDAYQFMELAKDEPRIIGDFVWSGMDYLGEVGIGSWEYSEYAKNFSHGMGWVAAGSGRVDLTGKPLSEADYTKVAFGLDDIAIGVVPVKYAQTKHSPSSWKMSNAIPSWSWSGCDGMKTNVEVYARAYEIELFINEKLVGKKKTKNDCKVIFKNVSYYSGQIRAIAYDSMGNMIASKILKTAKEKSFLKLVPEKNTVDLKTDLAYVRLSFADENGIVKPLLRDNIKVEVNGGKLLGLGSACPYYEKSYLSDECDTYYGEALAIIKPYEKGLITIEASGDNTGLNGKAYIEVV